jgi:hypothetical protein
MPSAWKKAPEGWSTLPSWAGASQGTGAWRAVLIRGVIRWKSALEQIVPAFLFYVEHDFSDSSESAQFPKFPLVGTRCAIQMKSLQKQNQISKTQFHRR